MMLEKLLKKVKTLAFRIHLLKGICFTLLFILGFRLYQMQILYSADYAAFLEQSSTTRISMNVPRGIIFDRNMEVLVDNDAVPIITYTFSTAVGPSLMREMAYEVARLMETVDPGNRLSDMAEGLRAMDLQDLWIITNPEEAQELVPNWIEENPQLAQQMVENLAALTDEEFYLIQLEAITDEMLETLTIRQKAALVIFNAMNQGINGTINIVQNEATEEEIFVIAENLRHLPGFNIGTSWMRNYPSKVGFMDIFGRVTSYEQGLPRDQAERLRALGYRNNDRVGTGQLEASLEPILSGINSQYDVHTENGITIKNQVFDGQPGMNVSLTIDAELQAQVDEILRDTLIHYRTNTRTGRFLREGYVVMLNPNTGEILSMNGIVLDEDENDRLIWEGGRVSYRREPLGTIWNTYEMGSTVKGATLLLGFQQGITTIGQSRFDQVLQFQGTNPISSWTPMGSVNEIVALARSSNIYFMLQTLQARGITYVPGMALGIDLEQWDLHRRFFGDLGLGSNTGIEVPEAIGQRVQIRYGTDILFHNIGQSDTYTTMQLAQYTMTLANGGYRFATQLVRDIFLPSNSSEELFLHQAFSPRLLNRIEADQSFFDRIRLGFIEGVQGSQGTGTPRFAGVNYNPAGKTGTAQTFLLDQHGFMVYPVVPIHNVSFVGWAPAVNPEVAIAVILPAGQDPDLAERGAGSNFGAQSIAAEAMQAFFDLREKR